MHRCCESRECGFVADVALTDIAEPDLRALGQNKGVVNESSALIPRSMRGLLWLRHPGRANTLNLGYPAGAGC